MSISKTNFKNTKNSAFKDAVLFKVVRFVKSGDTLNDIYYQRPDKNGVSYVDYIARWSENEKDYQANTFDLNGDYLEPKKIQELILKKDKKQLLWDTIISFPKSISENVDLTNPKKIMQGCKKAIEHLWKNNNLDPKNINAWFALHLDTDNIHIHLGFLEKEAKFKTLNKNNQKPKYEFKRKGDLLGPKKQYLYQFIKQATLGFNNEIDYQEVLGFRNQTINEFKNFYLKFEDFEKKSEYKELLNKFKVNKFYKPKDFFYNNQSLETKKIVNAIVIKKINQIPELQKSFNNFLKTVKKASWKNKELDKLFNITKKNKFWIENVFAKSGIMPRLGNIILKNLRKYLNDKYHAKIVAERNARNEIYLINLHRKKHLRRYKKAVYEIAEIQNKDYLKKLHLSTAEKIKKQIENQTEHYKQIYRNQLFKEEIQKQMAKSKQEV